MDLLRNRNFLLLTLSRNISRFGDRFTLAALLILVVQISHGSPVDIALIGAAALAPSALLGWFIGPLVDRLERRTSMIFADLVRFVAVGAMFFAPNLISLMVLAFLANGVWEFYRAAYQAVLPVVVGTGDQLTRAHGLDQSLANGIDVIGYALVGLFILVAGVRPAFLIDAATFLASAVLIRSFAVRVKAPGRTIGPGYLAELKAGMKAVSGQPLPRALLSQIAIACLPIGAFNALLVLLLPDVFHVSATLYPYLPAVQGVSMVLGGMLLTRYPSRVSRRHLINIGLAGSGLITALLGVVPSFVTALGLYFVLGFFNIAFLVPLLSWYQQSFESKVRGRAMAIYAAATSLSLLVATLVAGPVAQAIGVGRAVLFSGIVFAAVGVGGYLTTATRIQADPAVEASAP
ncbi:MAG: MFS transporter [Sulfobacillus sp.]